MTIAKSVMGFVFEDKEMHKRILRELPLEKQEAVLGRKAKLIVAGPEGGTFIIRLTSVGMFQEENTDDLRNEIWMQDDTLIEILIWMVGDPLDPGISPREAATNGLIRFKGDRNLYDSEEIYSALEKHAFDKMRPIAKAALALMKK